MSNSISEQASATVQQSDGTFLFPFTSVIPITGDHRYNQVVDVTSTGGAISVGALATVSLLMVAVGTGTALATVTFYTDAGFTVPISSAVPQGVLGVRLTNPPTIYAKASAGTVKCQVVAFEQ